MKRYGSVGSILLGENDPDMRSIIRSILVQADLGVFLAADGNEAVSLAREMPARLVLLDIGMPHMNGLLACHAIRALPGYAHVPIIILTGYTDARMREAAKQVGADDFITKPFRSNDLLRRLGQHLGLVGQDVTRPQAQQAHTWQAEPNPFPDQCDNPELERGRRMLQIQRAAERNL